MRQNRTKPRVDVLAVFAAVLFVSILGSGCPARVHRFDADPRHICPGDSVSLAWDVTGSATIHVEPPLPSAPEGKVKSKGQVTIVPQSRTMVSLHVTRFLGHSTTSSQEITVVLPETLTVSLADPSAGCGDGFIHATATPGRMSANLKVALVGSIAADGRAYRIRHGGILAEVDAGGWTADFKGLPVDGPWELESPLKPGEVCGTATLPRSLTVVVSAVCGEVDR